jgi:endonuclease YncB( thermonuclease family)
MKEDSAYEMALAWAIIDVSRKFGIKLYMSAEEAAAAKRAGMWADDVCIEVVSVPMGYRHGQTVN